jgi:copper transport protein
LIRNARSIGRRSIRAAIVALGLVSVIAVATGASRVLLHATLLRSTPAANARLNAPPRIIRLVFSEQVVPDLSQISLLATDGSSISLKVANDPHDVHILIGNVETALGGGSYKVVWRVLSSDGHPVSGNFNFSLSGTADTSRASRASPASTTPKTGATPILPTAADTAATREHDVSHDEKPVPVVASLLRGLGLGALMLGVGLLFFGLTSPTHAGLAPRSLILRAISIGAVLLVAHMIMWMDHVSPTGHLSASLIGSLIDSTIGRVELLRTLLAVLALWAIALARHQKLAFMLGAAALVVSGAVGHPAAIDPYWAIPAKILHLLAASLWLGGLMWLVWLARCDGAACVAESHRVSGVALISVIVIALSGLLQTFLFLNTASDLIHSNYGRLVVAKMVGLAILIGFGAYHRLRLLPRLDVPNAADRLARSVKQEIAVVVAVILIGGFLAYVPTPPLAQSVTAAQTGSMR